jgi:cytochrome c biogenesis protein CcmG/thiol:disulfide interchange protein DsbE
MMIVALAVLTGVAYGQSKKAADFELKTSDGKIVQLSQLKGKVVLLNFWATWCGPCRKEIPDFLEVYEQYKGKGFEIVGVSLDEDGWSVVNPFVKQYKINYPIVMGDGKVVKAFGSFQYIPTTFLIDKQGNIVHTFTGLVKKADLEKKLKTLL